MQKRRWIATVLFFPVLTFVFMFGWLMIIIGESQIGTSRKRLIKTKVPEKHITIEEDTIEMGLMEQLNETQIVAE